MRELPAEDTESVLLPLRLFECAGVTAAFHLSTDALMGAILEIRKHYYPNHFHNWRHALMVQHKAFLIVCTTKLAKRLSRLDIIKALRRLGCRCAQAGGHGAG